MSNAVLDREDLRRTLVRIAHEIIERNGGDQVAMVGIHTRGAVIARRLRKLVEELIGRPVPLGELDISFYRDDVGARPPSAQPVVHSSRFDFPLEETTVVLVDDVLYTGRTIRAALDQLIDFGRPRRVQLAVLIDRGKEHRELPIQADYIGKVVPTKKSEIIKVMLTDFDEEEGVAILERPTTEAS